MTSAQEMPSLEQIKPSMPPSERAPINDRFEEDELRAWEELGGDMEAIREQDELVATLLTKLNNLKESLGEATDDESVRKLHEDISTYTERYEEEMEKLRKMVLTSTITKPTDLPEHLRSDEELKSLHNKISGKDDFVRKMEERNADLHQNHMDLDKAIVNLLEFNEKIAAEKETEGRAA